MKKIIVYIAMSLDGYIATKNLDVAWLDGDGSSESNFDSFNAFIQTIDTVILGYTTYNQIINSLSPHEWPYKGKKSYVITHKKIPNANDILFTDENFETLFSKLKHEAGKNIWICGGANIVNQMHQLGLIDEYHISVIPTILGSGIKLFDASNLTVKLKLISTANYNGIVDLVYKKIA